MCYISGKRWNNYIRQYGHELRHSNVKNPQQFQHRDQVIVDRYVKSFLQAWQSQKLHMYGTGQTQSINLY